MRGPGPGVAPVAGDLEHGLARTDLKSIGVVLVRRGAQQTLTVWCEPDTDPAALDETAVENGHEPGALILVFERSADVYVRPEWEQAEWLQQYVRDVVRGIEQRGLAEFLATRLTPGVAPPWAN